jgi:glycosyltransferase involved in cell wall biosynthesis
VDGASVEPALTVVVPFWDLDPGLLLEALASVAEQGVPARTIVVDNASTVALPALPPGVEVRRLPRRVEVGEARNAGLELVETARVLFLDADDLVLPGAFAFMLGQLGDRPGAVVSCGTAIVWRPEREQLDAALARAPRLPLLSAYRLQSRPRLLALVNTVRMVASVSCTVLDTAAVREAGGFSGARVEQDWALSAALAFRGPVVAGTRPVKVHRVRPGSLSHQKAADWRLASAARREVRRRLRHDPRVPVAVRWAAPILACLHARPALRRLAGRGAGPAS